MIKDHCFGYRTLFEDMVELVYTGQYLCTTCRYIGCFREEEKGEEEGLVEEEEGGGKKKSGGRGRRGGRERGEEVYMKSN